MTQEALASEVPRTSALQSFTRPSLWPMATLGLTATATGYIAANNPHVPGALGLCPLYATTGLYCPGCGGTRAVYDLAHGDILGALSMNPLFTLAVPLLAVLWVRWFVRSRGIYVKPWPFPTWLSFAIPGVMVAFAVLRNLEPFAPFLSPP